MEFKDWLTQTKTEKPDLTEFITKLDPFFTDSGFNANEFEKKANIIHKNIYDYKKSIYEKYTLLFRLLGC